MIPFSSVPRNPLLASARALIVVAACAGCSHFLDSPVCTQEARYGLAVQVADSVTGKWTASGSTLLAEDGTYADSTVLPPNRPDVDNFILYAAPERAGTYRVTVRKAGYQDWVQPSVQVNQGPCHVDQVNLVAKLQPAP